MDLYQAIKGICMHTGYKVVSGWVYNYNALFAASQISSLMNSCRSHYTKHHRRTFIKISLLTTHLIIQQFLCLLEPGQSSRIAGKPVGIECIVGAITDCDHYLTAHRMSCNDVHYY